MTGIQELEHRTDALEVAQNDTTQTLRWAVAKLGRIASVQDEHTLRLEKIETDIESLHHNVGSLRGNVDTLRNNVDTLRNDLGSLRRDMPSIVADAMREVLNKS